MTKADLHDEAGTQGHSRKADLEGEGRFERRKGACMLHSCSPFLGGMRAGQELRPLGAALDHMILIRPHTIPTACQSCCGCPKEF